ncbi:TRAP transporter TatT component family protein [Vreelandella aquamarina]
MQTHSKMTMNQGVRKMLTLAMLSGTLAVSSMAAFAYESELFSLQNRWEHTVTQMPANQREAALEALASEAKVLAEANSDEADVLVWQGIVLAAYARERGGLGALGDAKAARDVLERAITIDPNGYQGSAYVTLGALYDRVPGGLVGFGDSAKAEQMFQRALEIRPDGIDVNYYYAAFLAEEGNDQAAREHAQRALEGSVREGREASDNALRQDARQLLDQLSS